MNDVFRSEIDIAAAPDAVFRQFTDPALLVRWMGDYARLDAVADGLFSVDINGVLIRGHYVKVDPGRYLEIAWGELGNAQMPPGATRLVFEFLPTAKGTRLVVSHSGLTAQEAAKHTVGWPHFLRRLVERVEGRDPGADPWATAASPD